MLKKEQVIAAVQNMPEDASVEEIVERILFINSVEEGLDDVRNGRTISHEEMKKTINSWFE